MQDARPSERMAGGAAPDEAMAAGRAGTRRDSRTTGPADPASNTGEPGTSRRGVILAGLGLLLGGCASSRSGPLQTAGLPDVPWDVDLDGRGLSPARPAAPLAGAGAGGPPAGGFDLALAGLKPRSAWSAGPPRAGSINPMRPVQWITIHHDAIAYRGATMADARNRMQKTQAYHQGDRRWADIGYHFVVDRQGTVWQGRELRWQGAHVSGSNEGNIGVMLMGNFEEQRPSASQIAALQRTVATLQRRFRVPAANVRTHREWPGARTECPGSMLQAQVNQLRRQRRFG